MRKSFTWFLSFLVFLVAFANQGYTQEAQETVELYAQNASGCYKQADDYTVNVSVRDFIQLTRFDLDLDYNPAIFTYASVTDIHSSLSGLTVTETPSGKLNIVWSGTAKTIGDNVQTPILKLHFKVKGFPDNTATSFTSNLTWSVANFWYTTSVPAEDAVNTVTKSNGSLAVTIGDLNNITTSLSTETCAGGNVTVTASAVGATNYLFNEDPNPSNWIWTTSNTYQTAAGSTITVRVKDANGCISNMKSVIIPTTVNPVSFTVTKQDPTCYGGSGSVIVTATGGSAPYKYYINTTPSDTGATIMTNFQFAMMPGTYYVATQDANNCANLSNVNYWRTITITDSNPQIIINRTTTNVSCNGGNNGNILFAITENGIAIGKTSQVSINNGTTWGVVGDTVAENLVAGTYQIKVKNSNGCIVSNGSVTITQPTAIAWATLYIDDTSCGGLTDGKIGISGITGGTSPYTMIVESSDDSIGVTGVLAAGDTILNLSPTYYSLTLVDANGCKKEYSNPNGSGNVIAVQAPDDIKFTVTVTDPACNNDSALISVSNITGGTGTYTILFNGVAAAAGVKTYKWAAPYADVEVTVQNTTGNACAVNQTVTAEDVDNPGVLTANVEDVFAPTCINGNDGNIHLLITGGVKPYYYSVNNGTWKSTNSELTIIKVGVGTHTIAVKDKNNCVIASPISVQVTLEENVITATSDELIECYGDKAGTISVDFDSWAQGLIDGVPGMREVIYWVKPLGGNATGFTPSNQAGDDDATTFKAGKYVVWVSDAYNCESNKDTVEVEENPQLLIVNINTNGASCFQTYDGTITITAKGGTIVEDGVLEYAIANTEAAIDNIGDDKWLPFETYNDTTTISSVSFKVDGGTYWIKVRDNGCETLKRGPIVVEGYKQLLVDEDEIDVIDPLCYDDENGSITVPLSAVTGGAGAYKFTLLDSDGDAIEDYTQLTSGVFSNLPAGSYYVLVEDSKNCPSYTTEEIVLVQPDELEFVTTYQHMSCENSNNGTITVTANGGTMDYQYAINNTNSWFEFEEGEDTKVYIATEPGIYKIWVKDANGCVTGPTEVTILEPTALGANITVTNATCYGIANGSIAVVGTGGWAGQTTYNFKVDNGTWSSSTSITGLSAGNHVLHVKDVTAYSSPYQNLTCTYQVPFTVGSPAPITYNVSLTNVSCKGGSNGTLTVNVLSGGTPWNPTGTANDGYNVKITGNNYDSGYLRTGADNSITFTGLAKSHYTVYIQDANGCVLAPTVGDVTAPYVTIESWEISEPATMLTLVPEFKKNATCNGATDGQFLLHASGGVAPYKYYAGLSIEPDGHILTPAPPATDSPLWQTSEIFNVGAGTWVVWVLDANGCMVGGEYWNGQPVNSWRVKIEQPTKVNWAFHTVNGMVHYVKPTCYGNSNGEIHLVNVTGGNGPGYAAHVWGMSEGGTVVDKWYDPIRATGTNPPIWKLTGVPAGHYNVTVFDTLNCTSKIDTITIKQPKVLAVTLVKGDNQFTCANSTEGIIVATATGGTGTYSYQLLKNGVVHTPWQSISNSFLVQIGNTYTVQVKDENTCQAQSSITIDPVQPVVIASILNTSCYGEPKASARVNVTGEPGRKFRVSYKNIEGNGTWVNDTTWFNGHIDLVQQFIYDTDNLTDIHYAFKVIDNKGCESLLDTMTFDTIQHQLTIMVEEVSKQECKAVVKVIVSGGVAPYNVTLDGQPISNMEVALTSDVTKTFTFAVTDAHLRCADDATYSFTPVHLVKDTTVTTYYDEKVQFVYEEADLDTMLAVGNYTFVYDYNGCDRTLKVKVTETCRPVTVAVTTVKEGECSNDVTIAVTGITTYDLYVDGVKVTANNQTLKVGTHEIKAVYSSGKCTQKTTVTVAGKPVARTDEETTFKGEKLHYVDAEAKVDTMLNAGVHKFTYLYNTCTRTLTVTVTEVWRAPKIAEVQGTSDKSPLIGKLVEITGTVSGVAAGEGFFVQDGNAEYSGIWVEYSATTTQGIQIGNGVKVHGTVAEVANVTTILATDFSFIPPVLTLDPVKVTTPSAVESEKWESVLVKIAGGRATAQDASTKEWKIYYATTDDAVVNDWLFTHSVVKDHYYDVIGVVNARMDNYKVESRVTGDVKDLTVPTAVKPDLGIEFKVYPNPFNDYIKIDNSDKLSRVVISNIAGQKVIDVEYPESEIRTSNLVSGVYVISLFTDEGLSKSERIIKR